MSRRIETVRIVTLIRDFDRARPWRRGNCYESGGSGCVISESLILTNAHVVSGADEIWAEVDETRIAGHALFVDDERDLAIISLVRIDGIARLDIDSSFLSDVRLPQIGSLVEIVGFAREQKEPTVLTAKISAVGMMSYAHSSRLMSSITIDSSSFDGVSGGGVYIGDALIGISVERATDNGSLFAIPLRVVGSFLDSCKAGKVMGVPDLGVFCQKILAPSLRCYLGLPPDVGGLLVNEVIPRSSAFGVLRPNDVLVCFGGHSISGDGTIVADGRRLPLLHAVTLCQVGSIVSVIVFRNGALINFEIEMKAFAALVPRPRPSRPSKYYLFGGLFFTVLSADYMSLWDWNSIPFRYRHLYYDRDCELAFREEVVIIGFAFRCASTSGYEKMSGMCVRAVNGTNVRSLRHLIELSEVENDLLVLSVANLEPRDQLGTQHFGELIVVDREAARNDTTHCVEALGIPSDRVID